MKDRFSHASAQYQQYRPVYPAALIEFVCSQVSQPARAWDCGTGSGQLAQLLQPAFREVYATDISPQQLQAAPLHPHIHYSLQPAERTSFPDRFFNLVAAGQAVHWFDFQAFYAEVRRTSQPGGIIALLGYGRPVTDSPVDPVLDYLYTDIVGSYWDPERRYVDELYQTLPFPFQEIVCPPFAYTCHWSRPQLMGYLSTWSAVRHYTTQQGASPLALVEAALGEAWGADTLRQVTFPTLARIGRVG